jgi:hypothetical protein
MAIDVRHRIYRDTSRKRFLSRISAAVVMIFVALIWYRSGLVQAWRAVMQWKETARAEVTEIRNSVFDHPVGEEVSPW